LFKLSCHVLLLNILFLFSYLQLFPVTAPWQLDKMQNTIMVCDDSKELDKNLIITDQHNLLLRMLLIIIISYDIVIVAVQWSVVFVICSSNAPIIAPMIRRRFFLKTSTDAVRSCCSLSACFTLLQHLMATLFLCLVILYMRLCLLH